MPSTTLVLPAIARKVKPFCVILTRIPYFSFTIFSNTICTHGIIARRSYNVNGKERGAKYPFATLWLALVFGQERPCLMVNYPQKCPGRRFRQTWRNISFRIGNGMTETNREEQTTQSEDL